MSDGTYHHSPELLDLLTEAIWRLVKSKDKLLDFFRGSGVAKEILAPFEAQLRVNKTGFKMPIVARRVLEAMNARGDSELGARRRVLRRVVEWEDFNTCWPDKRDEAELYVGRVRALVNKADSFTRMHDEREKDLAMQRASRRAEQDEREEKARKLLAVRRRLTALPALDDASARGTEFESALNELFEVSKISVRDSFRVVESGVIQEQIDGAVLAEGLLYLVEVKWTRHRLGPDVVAQHMMRLLARSGALGLYVSKSGFTGPAIAEIKTTLHLATTICADWHEIIYALEIGYPLQKWIAEKRASAIANKDIYYRLGVDFEPPSAK